MARFALRHSGHRGIWRGLVQLHRGEYRFHRVALLLRTLREQSSAEGARATSAFALVMRGVHPAKRDRVRVAKVRAHHRGPTAGREQRRG